MATHVESKQPSTRIQDSVVNIDTLNINKTSTAQEIWNALPRYHEYLSTDIQEDPNTNKVYIDLNPAPNTDFLSFVQVFKDGVLLDQISENNTSYDGFYVYPGGSRIDLLGTATTYDANTIYHVLYTEQI